MTGDASSPFLTTAEAAAYLRVRRRTLANMRHRRTGPHFRKHGGRIVYSHADLDAWSNATRRQSTNERSEPDQSPDDEREGSASKLLGAHDLDQLHAKPGDSEDE